MHMYLYSFDIFSPSPTSILITFPGDTPKLSGLPRGLAGTVLRWAMGKTRFLVSNWGYNPLYPKYNPFTMAHDKYDIVMVQI